MMSLKINSLTNLFKNFDTSRLALTLFVSSVLSSCSTTDRQQSVVIPDDQVGLKFGLLLMAHGAGEEWNAAVEESIIDLASSYPIEIAFGMADAGSIEASVDRLEAAGVEHVGVVRMFVSGESWYDRTKQILGLQEGAPSKEEADKTPQPAMFMPMGFWKLDTQLSFYVSEDGLADAPEMDDVLTARIRSLSKEPAKEVAIVLAHGTGSDEEDSRWVAKITQRTALAKATLGLHDIKVFTLREDWMEKREQAQQLIRTYLEDVSQDGFTPLVVPFRVQGFGPYASVLDGLDYKANKMGLLPHKNVNLWIQNQAGLLQQIAQDRSDIPH